MNHKIDINNYSNNYKEYCEKVLVESKNILNKAGIKVFSDASDNSNNTDSVVIVNKNRQTETNIRSKKETNQNKTKNNNEVSWIRKAMPTSQDPMSTYNNISSSSQNALGSANLTVQNSRMALSDKENRTDNIEIPDEVDLYELEESTRNVDELSNASDDEGEGNLLRTFFEKDIKKGFGTNSYAGTKYERNIAEETNAQNVIFYSDNLYSNEKTSIIFGGTANVSYKSKDNKKSNVDYNVYTFWKQKDSKFTYGLGGLKNKKNDVNNINISAGIMHNGTRIFAILKKDITVVPGLPTHSNMNIDVGIGKVSGFLNPDEYNKKDKSLKEIDNIDSASDYVDEQRSKDYETDENNVGLDNVAADLIIINTDEHKEYGIKGGYIFRHTSDKNDNNYAFVMPFGAISNINVDSKDGAKFVVGAHAGQNINFGSGWHIRTKALLESSISLLSGSKPNDYIIANAHIEADKNKFSGHISFGTFFDNTKKFCRFAETELSYTFNKHWDANIKAGIANYKFDNEENKSKLFQLVAGVKYTL